MAIQVGLFQGLLFLAVVLVAAVTWVAVRNRDRRGATALVGMLVGVLIWDATALLASFSTDLDWILVLVGANVVGVEVMVPAFLVFSLVYTGRERFVTRGLFGLLLVEPAFTFAMMATNAWHGLFFTDARYVPGILRNVETTVGPAYLVHLAYAYAVIAVSMGLLLHTLYRSRDRYRGQVAALLVATFTPLVANVVYQARIVTSDPTTLAFSVSGLALAVAVLRYDFIDLTPVARSTVVDNITEGVLVLDDDGRIVDHNDAAAAMFEFPDGVIGRPVATAFEDYPALCRQLTDDGADAGDGESDAGDGESDARANGRGIDGPESDPNVTTDETVSVEVDGERRFYAVDADALRDGRGHDSGRIAVIRDVTEQRRRRAELERQNDQLEQFASLVSHDLRNPLNVADGYLELAKETGDQEPLREVARSHERMGELIDDVLALAREGRTVTDPEPVDLGTVAREAWENVDTADADLAVADPPVVAGDRRRLLRVFENLFRNSIEHGGESVRLRVGALDDGRRFFVEDDGTGIPEGKRDRVFEDGYSTGDAGTGLGLSIVQSAVAAHGWKITATGGRDGGARFEVAGVVPVRDRDSNPDSDGDQG